MIHADNNPIKSKILHNFPGFVFAFNTTCLCPTWRPWKPPGSLQCQKCQTDASTRGGGLWCTPLPVFALLFVLEFRNHTFQSEPPVVFALGLRIHLREPMADRRQWHRASGQQQEFDGEARGVCCRCSRSGYWRGAGRHIDVVVDLQMAQEKRRLVHSGQTESFKCVLAPYFHKGIWPPQIIFLRLVRLSTSSLWCKIYTSCVILCFYKFHKEKNTFFFEILCFSHVFILTNNQKRFMANTLINTTVAVTETKGK